MMEANKIMIGDKVAVRSNDGYDSFTLTVSEVKENGISSGKHRIFFAYDEIEPIPLTAEILARNLEKAFEKAVDTFKIKGYRIQKEEGVWWFGYINRVFCKICPANYVHELQHALRLVGLNELAYNLKIE